MTHAPPPPLSFSDGAVPQINAGVRQHGMTYSRFVPALDSADVWLNRKVLADLAATEPASFKTVVEVCKAQQELEE